MFVKRMIISSHFTMRKSWFQKLARFSTKTKTLTLEEDIKEYYAKGIDLQDHSSMMQSFIQRKELTYEQCQWHEKYCTLALRIGETSGLRILCYGDLQHPLLSYLDVDILQVSDKLMSWSHKLHNSLCTVEEYLLTHPAVSLRPSTSITTLLSTTFSIWQSPQEVIDALEHVVQTVSLVGLTVTQQRVRALRHRLTDNSIDTKVGKSDWRLTARRESFEQQKDNVSLEEDILVTLLSLKPRIYTDKEDHQCLKDFLCKTNSTSNDSDASMCTEKNNSNKNYGKLFLRAEVSLHYPISESLLTETNKISNENKKTNNDSSHISNGVVTDGLMQEHWIIDIPLSYHYTNHTNNTASNNNNDNIVDMRGWKLQTYTGPMAQFYTNNTANNNHTNQKNTNGNSSSNSADTADYTKAILKNSNANDDSGRRSSNNTISNNNDINDSTIAENGITNNNTNNCNNDAAAADDDESDADDGTESELGERAHGNDILPRIDYYQRHCVAPAVAFFAHHRGNKDSPADRHCEHHTTSTDNKHSTSKF